MVTLAEKFNPLPIIDRLPTQKIGVSAFIASPITTVFNGLAHLLIPELRHSELKQYLSIAAIGLMVIALSSLAHANSTHQE
jgi:hypothetical protein